MKACESIITEEKDGIMKITLNNPDALNSMTPALLNETYDALMEAEENSHVRVVIITGTGRAYCAGGDLPYILTLDSTQKSRRYIQDIARIVTAITGMPKPVIAMVNGVAAGAGFSVALSCDLIFCSRSARFSQSFVRIGLIPDASGTYFLPRAIGLYRAKELMFMGDVIDSETARKIGLVNRIVDDDKLEDYTWTFAEKLAKNAPIALGLMKKILNQSDKLDLQASIEMETGIQLLCLGTEDHKEGVKAFMEKRKPLFKGL
ncbi:MAG: 1,2-epoxyphenylacetyl-CoA isomerase [Syntrophus sp. SKADARSKE-3]|nr:1,2-epoxyphenylacetyl-CoA isomerase [Syntrophus sp. SKADARSKE-3]